MTWKRKGDLPSCQSCGDEGAEFCWLCHYFLCDMCLHVDYENHRKEAIEHGGNAR
jgi:hypothetical protein